MPQEIDLNISPYYDDYDPIDNYHQVLFKPGVPVQARELTGLQSILQNQIEKFGSHIFKDGARVSDGEISYNPTQPVVILDNFFQGINVESYLAFMSDAIIRGRTSGVRARFNFYISELISDIEKPSIYVDYISSSPTDSSINTFIAGEVLELENELLSTPDSEVNLINLSSGSPFATVFSEYPVSTGSIIYLNSGIYFVRGRFLSVGPASLILDQYTNIGSYAVGFLISERFINSDLDPNILDNSKGFNNFAAPGADRLQIDLKLIKIPLNVELENFITLKTIKNGVDITQPFTTEYNELANEFARRTFEQSGNFYVKPANLSVRETLNNLKGNNGIFKPGNLTYYNNTPSDDLATYVISPFKAYVKGFEVTGSTTTYIDFNKPRTTKTLENQNIIYNTGTTLSLNRIYGSPIVGVGNTYFVRLSDQRLSEDQTVFPGKEIGVARVYDFALESGSYSFDNQNINEWDINFYDIQTYSEFTLNEPITLSTPAHIEGRSSGATAFLRYGVTSSGILTAYNINGNFSNGEGLIIDGINSNRIITEINSYGLKDVKSIFSPVGLAFTFSGDVIQSSLIDIGSARISKESNGISTAILSPNSLASGISTGTLVSYTIPGNSIKNISKMIKISPTSVELVGITTVLGVNEGELPQDNVVVSDFRVLSSRLQSNNDTNLYTPLPKNNIESVNLESSNLVIRRQFDITITSNETNIISAGENQVFLPFDEERYVLTRENGVTENLSADKFEFISGGSQLKIIGLGSNTNAKFIATIRKSSVKSRIKRKSRINFVTVDKTTLAGSGIGQTTLNNGLEFGNYPYGTRVEDKEISLLHPEVTKVLSIIESSGINEPNLPTISFSNIVGSIDDIVIGEEFVGEFSNGVGICVGKPNSTTIEFINLNSTPFIISEKIIFSESTATAIISSVEFSGLDITNNFIFEQNQKSSFYDFSKIIRKSNIAPPTKKIKVIFESAVFDSSDTGDFVTANSYKNFDYCDLPRISENRVSDIIDIRPRVKPFIVSNNSRSPFEFLGRSFEESTFDILASDESFALNYSFYLPRIDRIFITKNGLFQVIYGVPDEIAKLPKSISDALEIASVYLPAYLCNITEATVNLVENKRYLMSDIRGLESRIDTLEYYTSLSLLESTTSSLQIKDANGLDRFKSGFFVDNFSTTINQKKITNVKNSIDIKKSELRPTHFTTEIDLILGNTSILNTGTEENIDLRTNTNIIGSNIKRTGQIITLNYNETESIDQPYSNRVLNVCPYASIFYGGSIELFPSSDIWVDQVRLEPKTINAEGNYIQTLTQGNFDPQNGFSPIVWDSWETNWTGSDTSTATKERTENLSNGARNVFLDTITTITTTGTQTRTGQQQILKEQIDNVSSGDSILNRQVAPYIRSRNVEFITNRLKPFSQVYPFFSGINFTDYTFPKLIQIEMISGVFSVGETVHGFIENTPEIEGITPKIYFRVAQKDHKEGQYNSPNKIYIKNPYNKEEIITETYTENSNLINIDTYSLSNQPQGDYYGRVVSNMKLIGLSSGAEARVLSVKLISDEFGRLSGSFFIPNPNLAFNPKFEAGDNLFRLTSNINNSELLGSVNTSAEIIYSSAGSIDSIQENITLVRNAKVETVEKAETRNASDSTSSTSSTLLRTIQPPPPPPPAAPAPPPAPQFIDTTITHFANISIVWTPRTIISNITPINGNSVTPRQYLIDFNRLITSTFVISFLRQGAGSGSTPNNFPTLAVQEFTRLSSTRYRLVFGGTTTSPFSGGFFAYSYCRGFTIRATPSGPPPPAARPPYNGVAPGIYNGVVRQVGQLQGQTTLDGLNRSVSMMHEPGIQRAIAAGYPLSEIQAWINRTPGLEVGVSALSKYGLTPGPNSILK